MPGASGASRKEQKRLEAETRNTRSKGRKAQQQIVHHLEKQIQQLEQRQAELTAELEKPETYGAPGRAMQVNRELVAVQEDLAALTAEWDTEATKLAGME